TDNMASTDMQVPYSYQASIGFQRQVGAAMSVESDYVFTGTRHQTFQENTNLSYNPATGANYPFTDASRRPFPGYGQIVQQLSEARNNYHGWQSSVTKRFSHGWQAAGTYLLSGYWDDVPGPYTLNAAGQPVLVPFPVAPDLGGEYTLGVNDQR